MKDALARALEARDISAPIEPVNARNRDLLLSLSEEEEA
jgi:hypothetical protein